MTLIKLPVKRVSSAALLLALFFLIAAPAALSQSRSEADPTTIETFPVSGDLPSGTYYYQFRTNSGPATAVLDVTTPDGGGSVSASFSGPACCSADAYVSAESGRAERLRNASNAFTVESRQKLLITLNVSVAKGRTVRFSLNFSNPDSGSGIIVTTTSPAPPPSPSPATCTDLAVTEFSVIQETSLRKVIKGNLLNLSPTAYYGGGPRSQYVAVYEIAPSFTEPQLVGFWRFIGVPAHGMLNFHVEHVLTAPRITRYEVRIVYLPDVATNRATTDDDCNDSNNSTQMQLTDARPPLTPATPTSGICTDLSLASGFEIREVGATKYIKGYITNLSDTAYSGTARGQGLQVTVLRVGEAPRLLPIMRFTEVSARGSIPYSIRDTSSGRRPPAYEARIIYSSLNATDRLEKNDDCNPANDYSRGRADDVLLPLEKLPDF
jgi:hypothetical protein